MSGEDPRLAQPSREATAITTLWTDGDARCVLFWNGHRYRLALQRGEQLVKQQTADDDAALVAVARRWRNEYVDARGREMTARGTCELVARVEYRRQDERRLLLVTIEGRLTVRDVEAMLDYQAAAGTWGYGVVYDERAANVGLTADDMRSLARRAMALTARKGPRGLIAIVATADVDYGLNRMVAAYADAAGYEIAVFRRMDDALAWISEAMSRR